MRITASGVLRATAIAFLWLTVTFILAMIVQRSHISGISFMLPLLVIAVAIPATLFASRLIARAHVRVEFGLERKPTVTPDATALKNSDLSVGDLRDMMYLLNEDDLDDLRAELREALRSRIRGLTGGAEFESFEHLLAEPEPRQRAKRG